MTFIAVITYYTLYKICERTTAIKDQIKGQHPMTQMVEYLQTYMVWKPETLNKLTFVKIIITGQRTHTIIMKHYIFTKLHFSIGHFSALYNINDAGLLHLY